MTTLLVFIVIAGCAAYFVLNSTILRAFGTLLCTLLGLIAAYAYFEVLASVLLSKKPELGATTYAISFGVIFIIAFMLLLTIAQQIKVAKVDLGPLTEKVGRGILGFIIGIMFAGVLLTILNAAPLPEAYPYQRFEANNPQLDKPNSAFLNADGFTAGIFKSLSGKSLGGKISFAAIHPQLPNDLYLNRVAMKNSISSNADKGLKIDKKAVWLVGDSLKDIENAPVSPATGKRLVVVRFGLNQKAFKDVSPFKMYQVRCIGVDGSAKNKFKADGTAFYAIGYLTKEQTVTKKHAGNAIKLVKGNFADAVCYIDFIFEIPTDVEPAFAAFKLDNIVELPKITAGDQVPEPVYFVQDSDKPKVKAKPKEKAKEIEAPPEIDLK
jgi:hypothetical protein